MSNVLNLKQLLYQLDSSHLQQTIQSICTWKREQFSLTLVQKAYRCFQADIWINQKKQCSGFGRSQEQASVNAIRIGLEGILDVSTSKEFPQIKKILTQTEKQVQHHQRQTSRVNHQSFQEIEKLIEQNKKLKEMVYFKQIPKYFLCPLGKQVMKDPVFTVDGYSFERKNIEKWLKVNSKAPFTGKELTSKILRPNRALKEAIQDFLEKTQVFLPKEVKKISTDPCKNLYKVICQVDMEEFVGAFESSELDQMQLKAMRMLEGDFHLTVVNKKSDNR